MFNSAGVHLIHRAIRTDNQEVCMNVYDVRLDDEYPACGMNWPVELKQITPYLRVRGMYLFPERT